ncbi:MULTISPECIES: hypothetical protein [Burkholderia]|nr:MULTISPECIES: hypothetical protein [Burkholderia]
MSGALLRTAPGNGGSTRGVGWAIGSAAEPLVEAAATARHFF